MKKNLEFYPCDIGYRGDEAKINGKPYLYDLCIDADMVEDYDLLFEKYENYPNGYGWEGLIITLIRDYAPEVEQEIDFDSEAGNFFCFISNKAFAVKLAKLISRMCAEVDFMELMLSKVPEELRQ